MTQVSHLYLDLVVEKNEVTLKDGQKLAFIRDDQEKISFRLLMEGTGVIELVESAGYVFEARRDQSKFNP